MPRRLFSLLLLVGVGLVVFSSVTSTAASSGTSRSSASIIGPAVPVGNAKPATVPLDYVIFTKPTVSFSNNIGTVFAFDIKPPPADEILRDECFMIDPDGVPHGLRDTGKCDPNKNLTLDDFDNLTIVEGLYKFHVQMVDERDSPPTEGNFYYNWTYDNTAPTATFAVSPASPTKSGTIAVTITTQDKASSGPTPFGNGIGVDPNGVRCTLTRSQAGFTPRTDELCTTGITYNSLPDGTYNLQVKVKDLLGHERNYATAATWIIDNQPPAVSGYNLPQYNNNGNPQVNFTIADQGAATLDDPTIVCSLRNASDVDVPATPIPCASRPVTFNNIPEGVYRLRVQAEDKANNTVDALSTSTITVDKTVPTGIISSSPISPTKSANASFNFSTTDAMTLVVSNKCVLLKNGAPFNTDNSCGSPKNYSGLSSGTYTFQVFAKDGAGNPTSATPPPTLEYSWVVDQLSPNLTIPLTTTLYINRNTGVEVWFFASDPSGLKTPGCWLDGPARVNASPCTIDGGTLKAFFNGMPDGSYKFTATVTDTLDNPSVTKQSTGNLVVDTKAPSAEFDPKPPSLANGDVKVFFKGSDPAPGSGGIKFTCTVTSTTLPAEIVDTNCASPKTYTTGDGTYKVTIFSTDGAKNASTPISATWTTDKTPPDNTLVYDPPSVITTVLTTTYRTSSTAASIKFPLSTEADFERYECDVDGTGYATCTSPRNYTFTQGWHVFRLRTVDKAGNVDPTPAHINWLVDYTGPIVAISGGPEDFTNEKTAIISFIGADNYTPKANLRFQCRLDASSWKDCPGPDASTTLFVTELSEGSHTFYVRARDETDNISSTPASYAWTVDASDPDTQITSAPAKLTTETSASFVFAGTDGAQSTAGMTFECKLSDPETSGNWAACTSPFNLPMLANGLYTFEVRSRDKAGNQDASQATYTWKIDTLAPDTTITKPDNATAFLSGTVVLEFTGKDNPGADPVLMPDGPVTFECRLDAGAWEPCVSGKTYTGLPSTTHTFQVRAKDEIGNLETVPAALTKPIDAIEPTTTLTQKPTGPTQQTSAVFGFTGDDTGGSGLKGFLCQLDGGTWTTCTSTKTYPGLADGEHTFQVRAVDNVSNLDQSPEMFTWKVDTTKPTVAITTPRPGTAAISSTTALFAFSGNDGAAGSGVTGYECNFDNAGWTACASGQTYPGLTEGSDHTFQVRATDAVGLVSDIVTFAFKVDLSAPTTQLTSPPQATDTISTTEITFGFIGADNLTAAAQLRFECSLDGGPFSPCASNTSHQYSGLSDGAHTFRVRAVDQGDNADPTPEVYTWTIDATAPNSTILSKPAAATKLANATFTFNADDGTGTGVKTVQCKLDNEPWTECLSTKSFDNLAEGPHTFQVRAIDRLGNIETSPDSFAWVVDTLAPETLITAKPASPTNQTSATFSFTADDGALGSGLDIFECSLDGGPFNTCISGSSFPGLRNGTHTFRVRARDKALNVDPTPATYTWVITDGPTGTSIFLPITKKS